MATLDLWERIVGSDQTDSTGDPQDTKIALHRFWGIVWEWQQGYETQQNVINMFDIATGAQISQAQSIKQHINAAPDKVAFLRVCKDWSYAGEFNYAPEADKYRDFAQFETRMANEVTEQGGTAP